MSIERFDHTIADVQATPVEPVSPEAFDFEAYDRIYEICGQTKPA
jgi:hypothetical protein